MLQINKANLTSLEPTADYRGASLTDASASLAGILRRQFPVILILLAATTILGLLYCFTTPPSYTASATMVIDTRKPQMFQQQAMMADSIVDAGMVQTQVEVLKSQNISLAVIREQHLLADPEFTGRGAGLLGMIADTIDNLFSTKDARSEAELTRRALQVFEARRNVSRVGITYAMEVSFRSLDAEKAARIANAIVDAYIIDQMEAKYQATKRASAWLQARITDLRTQSTSAEKAVVDFKDKNNILETGGRLMNEQQLSEINTQLVMAHASTMEAKARYEQVKEVMKQDVPDGSIADALKSEVIIKLRGQYLDLAAREAIWTNKYGAAHQATVNLRNQMQELRHSIADEMQKIAESYRNDLQISEARELSIRTSLASAVSQSQLTNQAQVQLRDLESNAQSYRSMYDSFLNRYMESVQQQSFPVSEARLITPATKPLKKSEPNTALILSVSVFTGLMAGFGAALFRELSDRVFRTGKQIEDTLQVNCLATLPQIKSADTPSGKEEANWPEQALERKQIRSSLPYMYRYVVEAPFSQFAEGLRSLKVATDLNGMLKANKVIGITSTLPNEGKSTIATNFAALIAHSGARAILIDADLRNPSLSRVLAPPQAQGLVDILGGKIDVPDAIWSEPSTGLSFIPAGSTSKLLHTNEILRSPALKKMIDDLRSQYDYVIVDFPPLVPVVDTRNTTSFIDSYVYVIEWGTTKIDVVEQGLAEAREVYERLLGVVLNKADLNILGRYERYRSRHYYRKYYRRYGYVE